MKSPKARFTQRLARFCKCESGATAIEYGLIAVMISVAAIAAYGSSGNSIGANFNTVSDSVGKATSD